MSLVGRDVMAEGGTWAVRAWAYSSYDVGRRDDSSSVGSAQPIRRAMSSFIAMLIASLAGWLVESPVRAMLGPVASMSVSLVVSAVAFYYGRRFIADLRGDA